MIEEFEKLITKEQQKKTHDGLLDELKLAILECARKQHQWDNKAMDSLVRFLFCVCEMAKNDKFINLKESYTSERT